MSPGQNRYKDHAKDHELDVARNPGHVLAQEIAEAQHAPDPGGAAEDAEGQERAVVASRPTPATSGANVRTIGMNRQSKIVLAPYRP